MTGVALGALGGAGLMLVLARGRLRRRATAGAACALAAGGVCEEVIWRGLVLARLGPQLGVGAALAVATVGFAATHVPLYGLHGGAVHSVTGAVFGGLFLTGGLRAAATAHATYNALLAVGADDVVARVRGVHKRLGATDALRGVDLDVRRGEVVVLLGPNGAGKTTLVDVLVGLRRPDRGTVDVRPPIGVTPQGMGFPPTLRVAELVRFACAHYENAVATDALLARFGLSELAHRQAGGLSGGETRRLAVALAFAGDPALAVLDEPTTGLDLASRNAVWSAIRAFAVDGGGVLLTTHSLEEARALARRVVVISHGSIVAEGVPSELAVEDRFLALTGEEPP